MDESSDIDYIGIGEGLSIAAHQLWPNDPIISLRDDGQEL
jgi:hypothetical protein